MQNLLTAKQIGQRYNYSTASILEMRSKNKLPSFRINGKVFFEPEKVEKFFKKHKNRRWVTK